MTSGWRQFFTEVQRALPSDATPQERAAATKRAASEWRSGQRSVRRNPPDTRQLTTVAIGAGALYLAYHVLKGRSATSCPSAPSASASAPVSRQTGL